MNYTQILLVVEGKMTNFSAFKEKYMCEILKDNDKLKKKVINGTYNDVIVLNGKDGTIKKEDILNSIEQLKKNSIELDGKKFLIIKNIENSTQQSLNALLKFFDNLNDDVFVLITTSALNKVLPTIKSRAQLIKLDKDNKGLANIYDKYEIYGEEKEIFNFCFNDINYGAQVYESGEFKKMFNNLKNILLHNIKEYKKIFTEFNNYTDAQIKLFLDMALSQMQNNVKLRELINNLNYLKSKSLIFNMFLISLEWKQ